MWAELFDGIKMIGSLVGLFTGGFLIYDRLIRSRPVAYLGVSEFKADIRAAASQQIGDRRTCYRLELVVSDPERSLDPMHHFFELGRLTSAGG